LKQVVARTLLVVLMGHAAWPALVEAEDVSLDALVEKQCPAAARWLDSQINERAHSGPVTPASPPSQPALRDELVRMRDDDVAARTPMQQAGEHPTEAMLKHVQNVDSSNLLRLKAIVDKQGLPTADEVGNDGLNAVFLLTQHADTDPQFQRRMLAMNQASGYKGFYPADAAMLSDRVALHLGEPQQYGSQFEYKNGKLVPRQPIDDLKRVDARRTKAKLMPLNDYACMLQVLQSPRQASL
jgi:hypothetical protein